MNGKISKYLFLLCIFVFSQSLFAQWISDSKVDSLTLRGVEFIYNLKFDSARSQFNEVVRLYPKHPSGHFFLAMVEWWRILINPDDTSYDEYYYSLLDKVIYLCDEILKKNPNDVTALFFKGGSIGFRGRLRVHREQWLYAANDGRLAIPIVHQAYQLEPNNVDVLLGMGIYNYYRDVIPEEYPFVKPFVIFFPKGDKMLGIQQLKYAAENAKFANYEATYFLIQILSNYEKKFSQALSLAQKLYKKFPTNPVFHRYVGRLYASVGKWEETRKMFSEILENCNKKLYGYNVSYAREAYYYLGLSYMNIGKYDDALNYFYRCDELSRSLDTNGESIFMVIANLKIGMIYDLQFKRELAIKQYNKVLNMKSYQNSKDLAKEYLKSPYGK